MTKVLKTSIESWGVSLSEPGRTVKTAKLSHCADYLVVIDDLYRVNCFLEKPALPLELPNSAVGTSKVGLWARKMDKTAEGWIQADRGGRARLIDLARVPGRLTEAIVDRRSRFYVRGNPYVSGPKRLHE